MGVVFKRITVGHWEEDRHDRLEWLSEHGGAVLGLVKYVKTLIFRFSSLNSHPSSAQGRRDRRIQGAYDARPRQVHQGELFSLLSHALPLTFSSASPAHEAPRVDRPLRPTALLTPDR